MWSMMEQQASKTKVILSLPHHRPHYYHHHCPLLGVDLDVKLNIISHLSLKRRRKLAN